MTRAEFLLSENDGDGLLKLNRDYKSDLFLKTIKML